MKLTREYLEGLTLPQLDVVAYFVTGTVFFCDKEFAIKSLEGKEVAPHRLEIMETMLDEVKKI